MIAERREDAVKKWRGKRKQNRKKGVRSRIQKQINNTCIANRIASNCTTNRTEYSRGKKAKERKNKQTIALNRVDLNHCIA